MATLTYKNIAQTLITTSKVGIFTATTKTRITHMWIKNVTTSAVTPVIWIDANGSSSTDVEEIFKQTLRSEEWFPLKTQEIWLETGGTITVQADVNNASNILISGVEVS